MIDIAAKIAQPCRVSPTILPKVYVRPAGIAKINSAALAHADGSYPNVLARFARIDVLVLDDWGLTSLTEAQRQDLLEVLEDRDGTRSTILTSQLPRDQWHDYLGEPTVANAIRDRVVHRAVAITLTGPSRRKEPPRPADPDG